MFVKQLIWHEFNLKFKRNYRIVWNFKTTISIESDIQANYSLLEAKRRGVVFIQTSPLLC